MLKSLSIASHTTVLSKVIQYEECFLVINSSLSRIALKYFFKQFEKLISHSNRFEIRILLGYILKRIDFNFNSN